MPHIFITRNLEAKSPLKAYADSNSYTVTDRSLITFSPITFHPPLKADVWFFYSPRAVEFSLNGLDHVAALPNIAAMGPGTAKLLEDQGWPVDFTGQGDPVEVTQQFMEAFPKGSVFFPRARQSRRSVQRMLTDDYRVIDAICYDNVATVDPPEIEATHYVFTSPLNVRAYLSKHQLPVGASVFAIGPSTGTALTKYGVKFSLASTPSERSLIEALREG